MSRFLEYIDEVCDGSGSGPKDGTGMKKRKRKGKGKGEGKGQDQSMSMDEGLAETLVNKTKKEFDKIAGEKVEVDYISGAIYGYCSELGTYRLFLKYTNKGKNNPGGKFDYGKSKNLNKFYFRMELNI